MDQFKRKYSVWNLLDLLAWASFFVSSYLFEYNYHLFVPSIYLVIRAIFRRTAIKTDLKNAVDYCRVNQPAWRTIVLLIFVVVVVMTFTYAYEYLENFIKRYLPDTNSAPYAFFIFTVFITSLMIARLQNFYTGVRWYISGIKLPGERSLLIPWHLVDEVKFEDGNLQISTLKKQYFFRIKKEDQSSANYFVRWFHKKKQELPHPSSST